MMFSLIDNYTQDVLATSNDRAEIEKELHDWQDETGLFIYSIVGQTQQGESIPETFLKADRDAAKSGLSPLQLAYVEKLEAAVKAADSYWTAMQCSPMSPAQYACSEALLEASSLVNFCSEQDMFALAECHTEEEADSNELPRDVIFS